MRVRVTETIIIISQYGGSRTFDKGTVVGDPSPELIATGKTVPVDVAFIETRDVPPEGPPDEKPKRKSKG